MEEFDLSLKELLDEQCAAVRDSKPELTAQDPNRVTANSAVFSYIQSLDGYTDWRFLPSQSVYNIGTCFAPHPEFGEPTGFIDGGLILKKGKLGMLFYQGGVAARGSSDNADTAISYEALCRAIIRGAKGDHSLKDYNFRISYEGTAAILANGKMLERLTYIKDALLSTSEAAQAAYDTHFRSLIRNLSYNASEKNYPQARRIAQLLCEYSSGNRQGGYPIPVQLDVILLMMQHQFDEAADLAHHSGLNDWAASAVEKKQIYLDLLSRNYCKAAEENYSSGKIKESLENVKKSLDTVENAEAWKLYIKIVAENASEDNMYLHEDIDRLTHGEISPMLRSVLTEESDKEAILSEKYEKFIEKRRDLMMESLKNSDIQFFRENRYGINTYRDKYGMTPLGYAALLNKVSILPELMNLIPNNTARNVLGHDLIDMCAFSARSIYDYDFFAGRFDQNYQNLKRSVPMNMPYQGNIPQNQQFGVPQQNQFYPNQQPQFNNGYPQQQFQPNQPAPVSFSSDPRVLGYYNDKVKAIWTPVIENFRKGMEKLPEFLDSSASVSDYMSHPTYKDIFPQRKEQYINDIVRKKAGAKGEFETSEQYEERQSEVKKEAENEFDKNASKVMKVYEDELKEKNRLQNLCAGLSAIYIDFIFTGNAAADQYDADKQAFPLNWNGCETSVSIPLDKAPAFKDAFSDSGVPFSVTKVTIDEDRTLSADCSIEFDGTSYPLTITKKV